LLEADGIVVPEGDTLRAAFEVFGRSRRLAVPDAYPAARALDAGPAAIATFDRALRSVAGIRIVEA